MNQPAFDSAGNAPPVPTTINWDVLDSAGYARTLREFSEWVGWFRRTYRVPATVFPPCWFAHPGIDGSTRLTGA